MMMQTFRQDGYKGAQRRYKAIGSLTCMLLPVAACATELFAASALQWKYVVFEDQKVYPTNALIHKSTALGNL